MAMARERAVKGVGRAKEQTNLGVEAAQVPVDTSSQAPQRFPASLEGYTRVRKGSQEADLLQSPQNLLLMHDLVHF